MPQINLLPWREELRKQRNKEFGIAAGVAVLLMGAVVGGVHFHFQQRIEFQQQRNAFLESEIAKLDAKIKQIQELDAEKQRLLARMQIIQKLQSSRPEIVHLFDEFVTTLPEGVYYTRIQQQGRVLSVTGVAQSNARVSTLMRQLDASEYLINPTLLEIAAETKQVKTGATTSNLRLSRFSLSVAQEEQKKPAEEEAQGGAGS
ncbi:MAG: PilN domain-containing protein [Gammaproteobacteria bacterium]|nr:PilN domain-containing protein [Gammaproteobacteria bacterium]